VKWKQWIVLPSALLVSLMGLVLSSSLVWAHQRAFVPPATAALSATVQLNTSTEMSSFYNAPSYVPNVESMVSGATKGSVLLIRMIVSLQPPQNGDLPNVAPTWSPSTNQGVLPLGGCMVGNSQDLGTPGTESDNTIPACPSSANGAIDWHAEEVPLPGVPLQKQQTDSGDRWVQAKLFALPQLSDLDNLHTEADWLQFRIGESKAIFLPSLQDTATPTA
jgi:hypothetical protein